MQIGRGTLVVLAIGLIGCGSSNSSPTPKRDAAPGSPDVADKDATELVDTRIVTGTDSNAGLTEAAPPSDAPAAKDVAPLTVDAGPAADVTAVGDTGSSPDSAPSPDLAPSPDSTRLPDAAPAIDVAASPDVPAPSDLPPARDASATGVVSSTSTTDPSTDPAVCATVKFTDLSLTADQTYDIVMPDCLHLSGTITLDGSLPAGAVYSQGEVDVFKIERDGSGALADTTVYSANVTAVDSTHFSYSVGVPAGTYEVMYTFALKSSAAIPSTVSRYGQDQVTISQNTKHDVTLSAIDVVTSTVTVTGTNALAASGGSFGRYVYLMGLNANHTLLVSGFGMASGDSTPITMWIPNESFSPTVMVQDTPEMMSPFRSGFTSRFLVDPVAPAAAISIALPVAVKISGTIADPNHVLATSPVGSPPSYYHCDSLDTGTFPHPILNLPETTVSSFFTGATSHAFYGRKGLVCVTNAEYAIAVGGGGVLTRAGENNYAFMQDPTPKSPNAVTLTSDLIRNIDVPALGTQITVRGTVKDAHGNGIAGANLAVLANTLTNPALTEKSFTGGVDATTAGAYVLHALPGTYRLTVALPKADAASSGADAGATQPADAGSIFTGGGSDANAADCTTLAACCDTLSGSDKISCTSVVAMNMAVVCSGSLSLLRTGGKCP